MFALLRQHVFQAVVCIECRAECDSVTLCTDSVTLCTVLDKQQPRESIVTSLVRLR
jgi:hypothetical protein